MKTGSARIRKKGQALTEYGLVIVLLGLAGLGGLVLYGSSVSQELFNLTGESGQPEISAGLATPPGTEIQAVVSLSASKQGSEGLTPILNGIPYKSPNSAEIKQMIETAGSNGTTDILASVIERIAAHLAAEEKLSETDAHALLALANQGHRIAGIEKIMEDAVAGSNNDREAFLNTPVVFEGKTYQNAYELVGQKIGASDGFSGADISKFEQLQQAAIAALANLPPVEGVSVQSVVEQLCGDIRTIADGFETVTWRVTEDASGSLSNLDKMVASYYTDRNSAGICSTGSGEDSGTQCR